MLTSGTLASPLDPRPGDYVVVGDDEIEPALAEVLSRGEVGDLRLRILSRAGQSFKIVTAGST